MGSDSEQHTVIWHTILSLAIKHDTCVTIPHRVVGMPGTVKLALMRGNQGENLIGWVCSGPVNHTAMFQLVRRQEWPQRQPD